MLLLQVRVGVGLGAGIMAEDCFGVWAWLESGLSAVLRPGRRPGWGQGRVKVRAEGRVEVRAEGRVGVRADFAAAPGQGWGRAGGRDGVMAEDCFGVWVGLRSGLGWSKG